MKLYQTGGGTWMARFSRDGKQVKMSLETRDEATARRRAEALERELKPTAPVVLTAATVTVFDAVRDTIIHETERVRYPYSHRQHMAGLERWVRFRGSALLKDVDASALARFVNHLRLEGHVTHSARRHVWAYVRAVALIAPRYGLPNLLVGQRWERPSEEEPTTAYDEQAIARMLASIGTERVRQGGRGGERFVDVARPHHLAAAALMALAGLRPGEVRCLTTEHLLGDGMLRVENTDDDRRCPGKTAESVRTIPLAPTLYAFLERHAAGREGRLILSNEGVAMTSDMLARRFIPRLKLLLGCERAEAKSLRRSFINLMVNRDVSHQLIESYVGHSASGLGMATRRHYLDQVRAESLKPVADAVEALIQELRIIL